MRRDKVEVLLAIEAFDRIKRAEPESSPIDLLCDNMPISTEQAKQLVQKYNERLSNREKWLKDIAFAELVGVAHPTYGLITNPFTTPNKRQEVVPEAFYGKGFYSKWVTIVQKTYWEIFN